jgi:hypothetical protein
MSRRSKVDSFADAMEERLRANDHKGGWDNCTPRWLLQCLRSEVEELHEALELPCPRCGNKTRGNHAAREVMREAADIANFAMMIADVRGALRQQKEGEET